MRTFPLQAAVTEPAKPFLHTVVVSGTLHVYVIQTARGELVFGASVDPFASYFTRGSLEVTEGLAAHVLALKPSLERLRVLRQWAGLCDLSRTSHLMILLPCPGCGPRDAGEFAYVGELAVRPDPRTTTAAQ